MLAPGTHKSLITVVLALAMTSLATPAAAINKTRVDYWLDRDPGPWTGGMTVIRKGGKYLAYGRFFEGRVCLSGRRSGDRVRMKGVFEQYAKEDVRLSWRLRNGMPRVRYTLGSAGDWRRVDKNEFINGTSTGSRLIEASRVTTPARWRSVCG